MEKLFRLSKVVAWVFAILALVYIALEANAHSEYHILDPNSVLPVYRIIVILKSILILLWFLTIVKVSTPHSPLRIPSIIGAAGVVCSVISFIIFAWLIDFDDMWCYMWLDVHKISSIIATLLHLVAFVWFSKFFKKGSLIQILAICLAVIPAITEFDLQKYFGYSYMYYLIDVYVVNILWVLFLFAFSKINK